MIISFPYGIEYALQYLYKPRIPNSWKNSDTNSLVPLTTIFQKELLLVSESLARLS